MSVRSVAPRAGMAAARLRYLRLVVVCLTSRASATRDCALAEATDVHDGSLLWDLKNCSRVTLTRRYLSQGDIAAFADALVGCAELCPTALELHTVPLDYEGSRLLGLALANGTALTSLSLTWNAVNVEGTRRLVEALGRNRTALTSLSLDSNGIGDAGGAAVARLIEGNSTVLRHASLAANFISDEGALALASALRDNTALVSVDLRHNRIGAVGLAALVEAVEAGGGSSLERLALEGNPDAGDAALLARLRAALDQRGGG